MNRLTLAALRENFFSRRMYVVPVRKDVLTVVKVSNLSVLGQEARVGKVGGFIAGQGAGVGQV